MHSPGPGGSWLDVLLELLKYFGVFLSLASGIWGTVNEVTKTGQSGRKHLTRAGRIALALMIAGAGISSATVFVTRAKTENEAQHALRTKLEEEQTKAEKERKRDQSITRNIIASGQRLRTFRLVWNMDGVNKALLEELSKAYTKVQQEINQSEYNHIRDWGGYNELEEEVARHWQVYPWLNVLATGQWRRDPVLVLIPLDTSRSTMLPLGVANNNENGDIDWAAGVELAHKDGDPFGGAPWSNRHRQFSTEALLAIKGTQVEVSWYFSASSFAAAIDRASQNIEINAVFPRELKIGILTNIEKLPVDSTNSALSNLLPWGMRKGENPPADGPNFVKSTLVITPNDLPDLAAKYEMKRIGTKKIVTAVEPDGIYYIETRYCDFTLWEGTYVGDND
jgi:hypothetical protein